MEDPDRFSCFIYLVEDAVTIAASAEQQAAHIGTHAVCFSGTGTSVWEAIQ